MLSTGSANDCAAGLGCGVWGAFGASGAGVLLVQGGKVPHLLCPESSPRSESSPAFLPTVHI